MRHANRQAYVNWGLLTLFFAYQYLLRVYPGIFTEEIRSSFHFSANNFATLSTYCICIYSCLQIPYGLLLDRFCVRGLILLAIFLCTLGQYLFSHTDIIWVAQLGRILIGIGAAPAYMSAVKMASDCFSEKICSILIGITCSFGMITIMAGSSWLRGLQMSGLNWRQSIDHLSFLGYLLLVACILFLKDPQTFSKANKQNSQLNRFWPTFCSVILNYRIVLYAFTTVSTCAVICTLTDLWGPSFFSVKYHVSALEGVHYNQIIFAGLMVGNFFLPVLFSHGTRMLIGLRTCCVGLMLVFIFLIYGSGAMPSYLVKTVLFIAGLMGSADTLCFAMVARISTPQTSALMVAWVNTINNWGLSLLQTFVAASIDQHWSGLCNEAGLRLYQASDYEYAFRILLEVVIMGLMVSFCLHNRRNKSSL